MTFYKISRGQGLALESWLWHPRQDHGERANSKEMCSPRIPWLCSSFCLLEQLSVFNIEWGRRGGLGTVYVQAPTSQDLQSASAIVFYRIKIIWERFKVEKRFRGVHNARRHSQGLPILAKSWNSTKWLKTELVTGLPFFQGQVLGKSWGNTALFLFSSV